LSSAASTRPKKICRLDTRPRAADSPPSRQRRIRQRWSIAWFRSARAWPALREALAWEAPSCFDADLRTPTRGVGSASGAQTMPRRRCSRRGPSSDNVTPIAGGLNTALVFAFAAPWQGKFHHAGPQPQRQHVASINMRDAGLAMPALQKAEKIGDRRKPSVIAAKAGPDLASRPFSSTARDEQS